MNGHCDLCLTTSHPQLKLFFPVLTAVQAMLNFLLSLTLIKFIYASRSSHLLCLKHFHQFFPLFFQTFRPHLKHHSQRNLPQPPFGSHPSLFITYPVFMPFCIYHMKLLFIFYLCVYCLSPQIDHKLSGKRDFVYSSALHVRCLLHSLFYILTIQNTENNNH